MKSNIFLLFFTIITMVSCTSKIDFTPVVVAPISKASDLLISEVSTGINTDPLASGLRSHYVEIYNGTNASVDLSNYAIGYNAVTDTFLAVKKLDSISATRIIKKAGLVTNRTLSPFLILVKHENDILNDKIDSLKILDSSLFLSKLGIFTL